MRAVILAGGKGVRLKPYTTVVPKPVVPMGGEVTIWEREIRQLTKNGFNHITIAVNHLANLIMAFFGDGKKWGVNIDHSIEEKPQSIITPLSLIDDLPDTLLVMYGAILTVLSFASLMLDHVVYKCELAVARFVLKL